MYKVFIIFIFLNLLSCSKPATKEFNVLLSYLPKKFQPYDNEINDFHYINSQLFSPLFNSVSDTKITSVFLDVEKSGAIDNTFKTFKLCLKHNVKFSNNSPITVDDFFYSLKKTHNSLSIKASIVKSGNCLVVNFQSPNLDYLSKLTTVQSTITSRNSTPEIPIGLGPYFLQQQTDNMITLKANKHLLKGNVGTIRFIQYDYYLKNPDEFIIHDKNLIPNITFDKKKMNAYLIPMLKSYFILINLPKQERINFVSCFNRKSFLENLSLELKRIPGLLPNGIMGFDVKWEDVVELRKCNIVSNATFYLFRKNLEHSIKKFFQANKYFKNIKFQYVNIDYILKHLYKDRLDLLIVAADSTQANSEEFFEIFTGKKNLLNEEIKGYKKLLLQAGHIDNQTKKREIFKELHTKILKSYHVIPLGQAQTVRYYPKNIKNIVYSNIYDNFPQIYLIDVK